MKPFIFMLSLTFLSNTFVPSMLVADEDKTSKEYLQEKKYPQNNDNHPDTEGDSRDDHDQPEDENDSHPDDAEDGNRDDHDQPEDENDSHPDDAEDGNRDDHDQPEDNAEPDHREPSRSEPVSNPNQIIPISNTPPVVNIQTPNITPKKRKPMRLRSLQRVRQ